MRVLGIHLSKGQLRYSVLEGTKAKPALITKERLLTPDTTRAPALMDWFDTQFSLILDQAKPNRIAYHLTLTPNKSQLVTSSFPLGILNLLAYRRNLPISAYVTANYTPSRLGIAKNADIYAHCDSVLGSHPPYWDKNQKYSVLAAWSELT